MKRGEARKLIAQAIAKGQYDGQTWRTINGTNVQIGDDGQIINGPAGLKDWAANGGTKGGGKGGKSSGGHKVVNGKDISKTYTGDKSTSAVLKAQGFDGLPKVVGEEEFQEAVEASSFIAQRTYSASSEEILKEYQDMLYDGEFYVDCSVGGSQYGQGMYCAADYNGELTEGIENEMEHYQQLGTRRNLRDAEYAYINTLTKDDLNSTFYLRNNQLTDEQARVFLKVEGTPPSQVNLSAEENEIVGAMKSDGSRRFDSTWERAVDALEEKYVKPFRESYQAPSVTETLTLDSSAKVISYKEIENYKDLGEQWDYMHDKIADYTSTKDTSEGCAAWFRSKSGTSEMGDASASYKWAKENPESAAAAQEYWSYHSAQALTLDSFAYSDYDEGALAALKGYDAINAGGHGESGSYTVVLNRTKLILEDNRIVTKAEGQVRMSDMTFEPGKNGEMNAVRDGKVIGWVLPFGTEDEKKSKKKTKKGGKRKMKKSEAQKIIDEAVAKAIQKADDDGVWRTINGSPVKINSDGEITAGPSNLKDWSENRNSSGSGRKGSKNGGSSKSDAQKKADDMNKTFGHRGLAENTTAKALNNKADMVKEYKDHSIAFIETQDKNGNTMYSVRVYDNDGDKREGDFCAGGLCATDGDAVKRETEWAHANIDAQLESSKGSSSSSSGSSAKDPFKNSYEVTSRVKDTYQYLKNTDKDDLYGRSTYFPGGWDDVQIDASTTGYKVYREQNPTYQANHTFSEVYHFVKDPNSKRNK